MGQFDQTARPLAKLDGAAFTAWALSCCDGPPSLSFVNWDDTRRLVRPGEPDRTNDLVALVRDEDRPAIDTYVIAEIEEEAGPGIFLRAAGYELHLLAEVNPSCDPSGPAVCSLVVNLSGRQRPTRHAVSLGRAGYGTRIAPMIVDVASQDAVATLERIERGELGLTILPFLALMKGGGTPEFITHWKSVAEREPNLGRRLALRDAVIVFAELTPRQVNWLRGLEGWMARESTYIKGWMKEGEDLGVLRARRADLITVIEEGLQSPVPESIRLAIEGTNDAATLTAWLRKAVKAASLADLRREMKLDG